DEGVLYRQLMPWATGRIARLCTDNAEPIGITIEAGDDAGAGYLTELGLVTKGEIRHHTYRWLEGEPMDRAPLPEGYRFVALEDDGRVTERWRLHKAVWEQATLDDRRYTQVRSAPYYRRDLDLCVETDAGELVAFALGWLDPEGGSCQFEPIGTHPDHRGKGIGKALVKEATHRVRELGADRCYINCSAKNEAGNALYAAAGYALVGRWQWWHYPAAGEST
ncbi:MAG: GNAT family N-acetyltransferase, partial [Chloroflexota bacterium]|nr:GNAT family N-acetyltransferase [Chloroflexota bacterium]